MADVRINSAELQRVLRDKGGPVGQILLERTQRVQERAVANVTAGPLRAFKNGTLRDSIAYEIISGSTGLIGRVGTNLEYALYVHEGTGIYGPRGRPFVIRPKKGTALAFVWKNAPIPPNSKSGRHVYRSVTVKGMRPRPFLRKALEQVMSGGGSTADLFR